MRRIILLIIILPALSQGQNKNIFPIWTYHQDNVDIHGVSLGIGSLANNIRNTNTNGIKVELIGIGILLPLIPETPVAQNDSIFKTMMSDTLSEKINGFSLSALGTICDCNVNGVALGAIGQINRQVNGVSGSIYLNFTQVHKGIQIALLNESYIADGVQFGGYNDSKLTKGIQIGVVNKSQKLKGLQIGIWNVNQNRKTPFINWNFKD